MFILTLVVALLVCCAVDAAWACPNCNQAVAANDPSQSGIVRGYTFSILFMMGMPFAMVGGFAALMYREVRKARATGQSEQPNSYRPATHAEAAVVKDLASANPSLN